MLAEVARVVRTPCCKSSQQAQLLTRPPEGSCCLEPAQQQWQAEAAIVADYQRLSSLASSQCRFSSQCQDERASSSVPSEPSQVFFYNLVQVDLVTNRWSTMVVTKDRCHRLAQNCLAMQVREDEQAANVGSPEKQCTRCLAYLPLDDFCINKRSPDGHFTQCRACVAEKASALFLPSASTPCTNQAIPQICLVKYS